jgi:hypothetical protein
MLQKTQYPFTRVLTLEKSSSLLWSANQYTFKSLARVKPVKTLRIYRVLFLRGGKQCPFLFRIDIKTYFIPFYKNMAKMANLY